MKRLIVIAALLVAPGLAMAEDSTAPIDTDRFKLWNECKPIALVVELKTNDTAKFDLKEERIETLFRSRLRAARIYTDYSSPWLYVNVTVAGSAFNISLFLRKFITDSISDEKGFATTWYQGTTGQSPDAGFILQSVSENTDKFIDEYLRVNAKAC